MTDKVQETLARIREEARLRAEASARSTFSDAWTVPDPLPNPVPPPNPSPSVEPHVIEDFCRRFVGELKAAVQDVAGEAVEVARKNVGFGDTIPDGDGSVAIYPENCKLLVGNGVGGGSLVIEEPPQFRTLIGASGKTYRLPMPYVVFLVSFERRAGGGPKTFSINTTGVGFGTSPIKSADQKMLCPVLPHTQGNRHLCQPMNRVSFPSIKEMAESVVEVFWNSVFHYDFGGFPMKGGNFVSTFEEWEEIGRRNPLDILQGDFEAGETVREVLSDFGMLKQRAGGNAVQHIQSAVSQVLNGLHDNLDPKKLADSLKKALLAGQ